MLVLVALLQPWLSHTYTSDYFHCAYRYNSMTRTHQNRLMCLCVQALAWTLKLSGQSQRSWGSSWGLPCLGTTLLYRRTQVVYLTKDWDSCCIKGVCFRFPDYWPDLGAFPSQMTVASCFAVVCFWCLLFESSRWLSNARFSVHWSMCFHWVCLWCFAGVHFIIDVNYFPSYKEFPDAARALSSVLKTVYLAK